VPHATPLLAPAPVSTQTEVPVVQLVAPAWHTLVGVHATFAVHGTQAPSEQTRFFPHVVPFTTFVPTSVQAA
jgi:hypothetical protein